MKTRTLAFVVVVVVAAVLLTALLVSAQVGASFSERWLAPAQVAYPLSYQGRLTDNVGNPIASQVVNLTFRLYGQQAGGTAIWSQARTVTTDPDGLFTTILEIDPPLGVADLSSMWLGVQAGADSEMTPRQRVGGAPFSFTMTPGNGISGTIDLANAPGAILSLSNAGTGNGLVARTDGQGVGVFGASQKGVGGYFTSPEGHAVAVDGPVLLDTNLKRVAMHRWYQVNEAGITLPVGDDPHSILFDGGFLWITNSGSNSVTRRRANDGDFVGTYPVGRFPVGLAYDGARLWVTNRTDNNVTRLLASNPAISNTIAVGTQPNGLCFDGRYVWAVNEGSNNVIRLRASTGAASGTFNVGQSPRLCAIDGTNVWITNHNSNNVTVLRSSDGGLVRTVGAGTNPTAIVFDGANMWVTNAGTNNVTKIRASDGAVLGTYAAGAEPRGITFDGFYVWVTNYADSTVTKLRVRDGAVIGTYGVGAGPRGITFDGSDIWVVNSDADSIAKQ